MDAEIDGSPFSCFNDLLFDLFLYLIDNLFDAGRVNASVLNEPLERSLGNHLADRVEAADHHRFGCVVNNDIHPSQGFQSTDVAAFAPDDAALHLLVRQAHRRHRDFGGHFSGDAL